MSAPSSLGRWVYGGAHATRDYPWPHCRFCGRAQDHDCPPASCQLCGSVVCRDDDADCRICHYGYIPGWWRPDPARVCSRTNCTAAAVAKAPRVRQVCADHARLTVLWLHGGRRLTLTEYVAERLAHRDSGRGWEHWRWMT
ncbi:MAG TPA: hypothetical protein VFC00_40535 [Micromonosporaceae bacterium]|nr:hypothetical protein [Micromonosporaceae bacterium]